MTIENKIIVAVDDLFMINNAGTLPSCYRSPEHGCMVYVHSDPVHEIQKDELVKNFDVLISSSHLVGNHAGAIEWKDLIGDAHTCLRRISKRYMQAVMRDIVEDCAIRKYRSVATYSHSRHQATVEHPTLAFGDDLPERFVIKPAHGARGAGHILVEPGAKFENALVKINCRATEELQTAISETEGLSYYSPDDNSENEGLQMLVDQGIIAQEYIENIVSEFRIIAVGGNIEYIQERNRVGDGFKQATGSSDRGSNVPLSVAVNQEITEDIQVLVAALSKRFGPFMSIDLFVTQDGEWGVFEFSHQFGIVGPGPDTAMRITKKLIDYAIRQALPSL